MMCDGARGSSRPVPGPWREPSVRPPLPPDEYARIYRRVPRLTVEVVVTGPRGVLLARRTEGPCRGLWNLPGGTVRYGEPLTEAVARVAGDEVGLSVTAGELLGYIEYPSHLERGIDWPVGLAFAASPVPGSVPVEGPDVAWFGRLPDEMHDEQRRFLHGRVLPG